LYKNSGAFRGARVEPLHGPPHERLHLFDKTEAWRASGNPLDVRVGVILEDEELRTVGTNLVLLVQGRANLVRARRIVTLANERRVLGAETLRTVGDPLVHAAEQRLGLSDLDVFTL
jgi:hypothetical protein